MRQTFGKYERLKSKKRIDELFASGNYLAEGPIKLIYKFVEFDSPYPAMAGVTVPKSVYKRAVDRNRFKRYMRESYRKNKADLYEHLRTKELQCTLMFILRGKDPLDHAQVEKKISALLRRLLRENA